MTATDAVRVLLVDDQLAFRSAAAMIVSLSDGFCVVDEAASGEEALERVSTVRPDLVLMDVVMPGMGGVCAAQAMAERYPEIVVALLSTYDCAELGIDDLALPFAYIRKDGFSPAGLLDLWAAARPTTET